MSDDINSTEPAPAKPPMRFRRLRIAASVFFVLVCVALCVLWVRSYSWVNNIQGYWGTERAWQCSSAEGRLYAGTHSLAKQVYKEIWMSTFKNYHKSQRQFATWVRTPPPAFELNLDTWGGNAPIFVRFPYWFAVLTCTGLAALPWLPWIARHFSLRTAFIATTLVAVLLGLVCYTVR